MASHTAYLVAFLRPHNGNLNTGKPVLVATGIFSEPSPSVSGVTQTALVTAQAGPSYADARAALIKRLRDYSPWLVPEKVQEEQRRGR